MHLPVLLREVLELLQAGPGKLILDGTFGRGGHSRELLRAGARVVALDQDPRAIEAGKELEKEWGQARFEIKQMNFRELALVARETGGFDGILLDLGVSSPQLDTPERGFSFQKTGPLDMRMNPENPRTAAQAVNSMDERELSHLLRDFGGEKSSGQIARAIVRARETKTFESTTELADLVEKSVGGRRGSKLHPATKTFQALRIWVNGEMEVLEEALRATPEALKAGGRLAVISFHELEDRMTKRFIESRSQAEIIGSRYAFGQPNPDYCFKKLGRFQPSEEEVAANPRARSARLRGAERIA
jgi:16S rRNA (cytosine1402-N4)-methyltransferase